MDLKFDLRRAAHEYMRRFSAIIYADEPPKIIPGNHHSNDLVVFWELARTLPREVMNRKMGDMVSVCERLWKEPGETVRAEWAERVAKFRLFCVCERKDNVLLWSHYADSHKGVAFELDGTAERGIPLSAAEPVQYSTLAPALHTRQEWIGIGLGMMPMGDGADVSKRLVNTKARAWAYEKEWRIFSLRRGDENAEYVDLPFDPSNVLKIFLGCRSSSRTRNAIIRLAAHAFSQVEIYQARLSSKKFALEFERVR